MLDSVPTPFAEAAKVLSDNIKLDPGFKAFYNYCKANGIPVIIVSSSVPPSHPTSEMLELTNFPIVFEPEEWSL